MVALQIRNVPEEVRDALVMQAGRTGQSLQGYLLALVKREAEFGRNAEVVGKMAEWADGSGATGGDVLGVLDAGRAGRSGVA
ncbi:MAG: hypothetical protein R2722_03395 [Tessaracoccus sp.]